MACCLDSAKPLPESMVEYCELDLRNNRQWKFKQNSKILIQENAFCLSYIVLCVILDHDIMRNNMIDKNRYLQATIKLYHG